jgi:TPR repeat protein
MPFLIPVSAALLLLASSWTSAGEEQRYTEEVSRSVSALTPAQLPALTEAAEAGDSKAQLLLGLAYFYGQAAAQDPRLANQWLSKAADQGDVLAQYQLAVNHSAQDTQPDATEAVKWFTKAAQQGHTEAQFRLGTHYLIGIGVAQDGNAAAQWFRKAADQNHAEAQWALGTLYQKGFGVAKSSSEAAKWYLLSAEQGFAKAEYYLATLYELGEGVARDTVSAYKWHTIASEMGEPVALRYRENLATQMSAEQVTQGEQLATEWLGLHQK